MKKWMTMSMSFVLAAVLTACADHDHAKQQTNHKQKAQVVSKMERAKTVKVNLVNAEGKSAGYATLMQVVDGVKVRVYASGLAPGKHGIHFHEKAICKAPTFKSAGAHFNPYGKHHGFLNPKGPHVGDLENIIADQKGRARAEFITGLVTLEKGKPNSLLDADGSALVIHAKADDYRSDPAGNAGDRVMCGMLK